MIRKLLVYVILTCMGLHCTGRLGILDHLYQNRNEIAHALGLITEVPIAMCSSDYDFDQGLKIEIDNSSHSLPSPSIQTREINLFFVTGYNYSQPQQVLLYTESFANPTDLYGLTLVASIFHPPAA